MGESEEVWKKERPLQTEKVVRSPSVLDSCFV